MSNNKEKVSFFQKEMLNSVDEAEKELKKQTIFLIVKAVGTLIAVIGTILLFAGGKDLTSTLAETGMMMGLAGELIACLVYKVFVYIFKLIKVLGIYIPIIGLIIGLLFGVAFAIYIPAIYAVISLVESVLNYKAAKEYLGTASFISDTVNESVDNGETEWVENVVDQIEENK